MYVASYRHTENGAKLAIAKRLEREQEALRAAERREAAALEMVRRMREATIEMHLENRRKARERGEPFRHSYDMIEARALRVFGITRMEFRSNRRMKQLVFARQFVAYWACRLTLRSLPEIGRLMGGRDHTTVLHGRDVYPVKRAKMGRTLRRAR